MKYIPYIILVVLTIIPIWKMLSRTGKSPYWSFFCFIPIGFIIPLWIMAYGKWGKE